MQSQKTVFRPLNARTPPAADTDRAGPALPPSKRISKGNRQSAFPRRWIRCGGVIPFVYIIWISRTATPSRRNGGVVAPERRYRLAGTVIPSRRNGHPVLLERPPRWKDDGGMGPARHPPGGGPCASFPSVSSTDPSPFSLSLSTPRNDLSRVSHDMIHFSRAVSCPSGVVRPRRIWYTINRYEKSRRQ